MKVDKMRREFYFSFDNKNWQDAGVIKDAVFLSDQGTLNWALQLESIHLTGAQANVSRQILISSG